MLIHLFPRAHARFLKLPLLGGLLEGLAQWLATQGFSPTPIRRRICKAPVLEQMLASLGIRDLGELSREEFLSLAPRPACKQRDLSALARSMTAFLAGSSLLQVVDPSPGELLVRAYLDFLRQVRGLADASLRHHRRTALGLLEFLGFDDRPEILETLPHSPSRPSLCTVPRPSGAAACSTLSPNCAASCASSPAAERWQLASMPGSTPRPPIATSDSPEPCPGKPCRPSWRRLIGPPRSDGATTPCACSWPPTACGRGKSPPCNWLDPLAQRADPYRPAQDSQAAGPASDRRGRSRLSGLPAARTASHSASQRLPQFPAARRSASVVRRAGRVPTPGAAQQDRVSRHRDALSAPLPCPPFAAQ